MGLLKKDTFICLDCEATGLDPEKDRCIEVAAIKFTFDALLGEMETLIDPEQEIPEASIEIHHITQEMVQGKPRIRDVLPELFDFIGDHVVVGHGIGYDISLINAEAARFDLPQQLKASRSIDTLRLARLYGQAPTNSLESLRQHFNVAAEGAHRARNDVIVNIEVFKHLTRDFKTTQDIFKVLSKPVLLKRMPLGKHKGRDFRDIPVEYLRWAAHKDFDQDLLYSIRSELKRRKSGTTFSQAGNPFANLEI
ncbi:MAG: DUF3820 family protein [Chlamydiia bacterium]|nr:DUF3820 family protein [Chlamydiia bacterium]